MSNDKKLAQLCAQIDKETDWQQLNQFVDEVVALLEAKKQEIKKLEDELRTEIEVRAARMRGTRP
jgi:HPt (histidine-containing phosphotransfer) domain-containing protein